MVDRQITVVGSLYGRDDVFVTFDGGLEGDPFLVDDVQRLVEAGTRVDVAGIVAGPATLDLDEPLLTRATLMHVFDDVTDVTLVGVDVEDDIPDDATA